MGNDLAWWSEGRFGLFIHFGIYAVSEGKWNGEEVPGLVEWMQCKKQIPISEYKQLAENLTLEKFDANTYANLAKAAGMKYVTFTAKHHDGFAMYDSKCSAYNVVAMCPAHRDIARELAEAVRAVGLKMCFYYSQALDWEDENAFGNTWDFNGEDKVYRKFLDGKCKMQLKELLTEYGDISMIWFDMPRGMSVEESFELKAYVKQLQPHCLVSGRVNMDQTIGDYGSMGDNEFPSGTLNGYWETPATLNNAWGYRKADGNWKTPEELLRLLIELLSKGMNYLLNIGPKPDGAIPERSTEILNEMGKWIRINQEAVYGTLATPFQFDFPWGRISRKKNKLYLYLLEKTENLQIPGIENQVVGAWLLTEGERLEMLYTIQETEYGSVLEVKIPKSENPYYDVVCLELCGEPKVRQGLFQLPDGQIDLYSHMADVIKGAVCGKKEELSQQDVDIVAEKNNILVGNDICIDTNGNIVNWFDTKDYVQWSFELYAPGSYEVSIQTRSVKYTPWVGEHKILVECDEQRLTSCLTQGEKVQNAHTRYFDERLSILGTIYLAEPGTKQITLKLLKCSQEEKAGLLVTRLHLTRK